LIHNTHHILRTYLRRLTNLSGNNRSLLLLRLHSEQLMDLHQLTFLNNESSFDIIKSIIAGKSKKVCAVLDSRVEAVNQASAKLKRLQRLDKFIFEERGSNDLHIGWPMIRGKFVDGTPVRCPLLYFPVSIVEENNHWVLQLREDAGVTLNKSFLLAYSFYNKVALNDDLPETTFDDFDKDSTVFRTQLYQLLKDSIELNFNPDTFTDELTHFEEFKKEDFEKQHKDGELKLFREAVLGVFPQAGSQLVPDYLKLIESESFADLEEFFSQRMLDSGKPIEQWVSSVKEEKIHTPFPQDAYQEHTLRVVKDGRSVVVQGPPGTGKSQLIANLIADGIASGKKILMVCQKRVALDVVYERLKKIGLEDFLGLIHDFRNDRKMVYEKISRQIDHIEDFKTQNRSVDVIQLERRFLQVCHTIDQLVEELEEFRTALFDERESGISIKELYLTSDPHLKSVDLRQQYRHFNFSTLQDFVAKLKSFVRYASLFEHDEYVWKNRRSFSGYTLSQLRTLEQTVQHVVDFQDEIRTELQAVLNASLNLEESESLLARKNAVDEILTLLDSDKRYEYFLRLIAEQEEGITPEWLEEMESLCVNCFDEAGIEATLSMQQLVASQLALHKRMEAHGNIFKILHWKLFAKDRFFLKRVLIANNLNGNRQGFELLERRIDNRLNLEHQLALLRERRSFTDVPVPSENVAKIKTWFVRQEKALRAKLTLYSIRELREVINVQKHSHAQFITLLQRVFTVIGRIPAQRVSWEQYLTPFQIRVLMAKPEQVQEFIKSLRQDFDNLIEFDNLKESLQAHETEVITRLHDEIDQWDSLKIEDLFQNSIRLAWIEHIEIKYPVLRTVSTFKMEEMETSLRKCVTEKQTLSNEILKIRARERIYESIEYNRLNNRVTYRDLHHQTTKKKKIWPVRKVIAEFSDELFNLMPCWMASPEAVSAIFPMHQLFDLVIFDEASQCFAERGIPAMYRGKQVIIAGDDKQLKPFELYQVRWTEDEMEQPDLEVSSLLELTGRYLPTVHLQGHYRSQSLPLIEFSNKFFYEGRLKLLPDKDIINKQDTPITFRKVNGEWSNNTNLVEALAVIDFALHMIQKFPEKEVGIITFNAPQQVLIMDLMEEKASREGLVIPQSLFIKNIENVQGDEKDIIIFSIGYAPDEKGKLSMQFGSLNVAGGENRLNVAVTRAREKIIVFSSIEPEDLKLQGIKNEGPKLLKKYLEYARDVSENKFEGFEHQSHQYSSGWYLNRHLVSAGALKYPQLSFSLNEMPFTDIAVRDGNNYHGAVLTDDQVYQSSLTVKEPHAYTPALLEQKHWHYHRVFSRNWWSNQQRTEDELVKFIYQATEE
jgi:hypothetical protein